MYIGCSGFVHTQDEDIGALCSAARQHYDDSRVYAPPFDLLVRILATKEESGGAARKSKN